MKYSRNPQGNEPKTVIRIPYEGRKKNSEQLVLNERT